jgi:hypothetical protein
MFALAVCGSLVAANEARAQERAGMYGNLMSVWYRASVTGFPDGIPSAFDSRYQPGECVKWTAAEKKDGAKPSDTLVGDYKGHPNAKAAGDGFSVTFADAPAICTAYEAQLKIGLGIEAIKKSAVFMKGKKAAPTAEDAKNYNPGAGEGTAKMGKDCIATIDAMTKAGSAPAKLNIDGDQVALGDLKNTCQAVIDYGAAVEVLVQAEHKAKLAEISKKYEAAGIKGAKLDLLIEYDDVYWRNTKCEKTDDVAELAKAKVLIHWLENSDGTQTIRRYTFNGSKVSKTEKTYNTEEAAQRGCR